MSGWMKTRHMMQYKWKKFVYVDDFVTEMKIEIKTDNVGSGVQCFYQNGAQHRAADEK